MGDGPICKFLPAAREHGRALDLESDSTGFTSEFYHLLAMFGKLLSLIFPICKMGLAMGLAMSICLIRLMQMAA